MSDSDNPGPGSPLPQLPKRIAFILNVVVIAVLFVFGIALVAYNGAVLSAGPVQPRALVGLGFGIALVLIGVAIATLLWVTARKSRR